jgi:hypothetical protein
VRALDLSRLVRGYRKRFTGIQLDREVQELLFQPERRPADVFPLHQPTPLVDLRPQVLDELPPHRRRGQSLPVRALVPG